LFWAGRSDKEACTEHSARWRKKEQRRKENELKVLRSRERIKRIKTRAESPFELSITTAAILDAIFDNIRSLKKIDDYCWLHLSERYLAVNVGPALDLLVASGLLSRTEEGHWYSATEKLKRWRRELKGQTFRRTFKESLKPPTY